MINSIPRRQITSSFAISARKSNQIKSEMGLCVFRGLIERKDETRGHGNHGGRGDFYEILCRSALFITGNLERQMADAGAFVGMACS